MATLAFPGIGTSVTPFLEGTNDDPASPQAAWLPLVNNSTIIVADGVSQFLNDANDQRVNVGHVRHIRANASFVLGAGAGTVTLEGTSVGNVGG